MNNLSVKVIIGFSLIIILAVISYLVSLKVSADVNENTEFVTRSETVIRISGRIQRSMLDMQNSFRGFLLTGREDFLIPYQEGAKEIPQLIEEGKSLIESESRRKKIDSIVVLHNQWIEYSGRLIEAKKKASISPDSEFANLYENQLMKGVGQAINDQIKERFREFDRNEYLIRQQRREKLTKSVTFSRQITFTLAAITFLVGIVSTFYISGIIRKRIAKMVNQAETISKGNFTTIEDNAYDELTQLSLSLNTMSLKLKKSFHDLDQFAYVVSHDLKAPLRGMYNVLTWIEEDCGHELSEKMQKYMIKMRGRIERMESLITGLLEYSKIGRSVDPVEEVDVREMVYDITEAIVPREFSISIPEKMPILVTEKLKLEQVFSNLISNAVKYNVSTEGKIDINYHENEDNYLFSISDNGTGIEPEYHEKIFKIFQTLRERHEEESTGIGLAIVKKIIEDRKGEISLISEKGKGSTFNFTWPKEIE